MSEENTETTECVKVKFLREVDFKGVGFAKGATAELEAFVAERMIAGGHAAVVTKEAKETNAKK